MNICIKQERQFHWSNTASVCVCVRVVVSFCLNVSYAYVACRIIIYFNCYYWYMKECEKQVHIFKEIVICDMKKEHKLHILVKWWYGSGIEPVLFYLYVYMIVRRRLIDHACNCANSYQCWFLSNRVTTISSYVE